MARRATSLGPKPSLFSFCFFGFLVFFFAFLSLFLIDKKPVFPPRKGHFLSIFNVSLSFSLNLFWPAPFSVSLSLSLSFSSLSFFLLVFLFAFFLFLVFVSFSCFFLLCFCFMKRTTSKYSITTFFPWNLFSFFGFLSCFLFEIPFSYLCFSQILSYVFCSTSLFLVSKNPSWKTPILGQKGSCNITGFFLINLCFAKCEKLSFFFWAMFLASFWLFFKKHYKNRHFGTFFEAKKLQKKRHFWMLLSGPSWMLLSGPSWLRLKKCQLGPDNNIQNFCAQFFFQKKRAETPIFIVFFGNRCFGKKANLDQIITSKRAKLGPDNNTTAIYIYIYIYML